MANEKLISASYLATVIRDDPYIHGRAYARMRDHIDNAPDAVKRGRWKYWAGGLPVCPVCGYEYTDHLECNNYCGNCGADMRGAKNG